MMVGKRHSGRSRQAGPAAVTLYGFQPPVGTPYNLEVNTVEDFFAQHDDWPWNPPVPGRATFHYLIAVTEGELRHDVDYVTRTVAPGSSSPATPRTRPAGRSSSCIGCAEGPVEPAGRPG